MFQHRYQPESLLKNNITVIIHVFFYSTAKSISFLNVMLPHQMLYLRQILLYDVYFLHFVFLQHRIHTVANQLPAVCIIHPYSSAFEILAI